jgi:hypothetical protein
MARTRRTRKMLMYRAQPERTTKRTVTLSKRRTQASAALQQMRWAAVASAASDAPVRQ